MSAHTQHYTNKLPSDEGYISRSPSMDPTKKPETSSMQPTLNKSTMQSRSPLPRVSSIGFTSMPRSTHRSAILGHSLRHIRSLPKPTPVAVPKLHGHSELGVGSGAVDMPSWTAYSPVPESIAEYVPKDRNADMEGDDELDELEDEVTDLDKVIPQDIQSPPAVSTKSTINPHPEPASIRSRPRPRAKHSIPTPHKSRVMRSLNSLGTKLAAEWAEAIDNYVDVLTQSAAKANAPKAKKLLLKAKWAMGNMYEARYNIRADIVADSGAAAAVAGFSELRTHADWSRDAIALWERAVEIAECWRKRFIPEDER